MNFNLDGIKAVIFDLDGTLFDKSGLPFHLIMSDFRHMFVLNNERKARKSLAGQYFGSERTYYETLYGKVAVLSHIPVNKAKWWYEHSYMPKMVDVLRKHYHLQPWTKDTLLGLREKGIKLAVFSDYGCVHDRLEALQFDHNWVDCITDAPTMGGLKPCKESLLRVCQQLGVSPNETLMVGDRDDTDGEAARRCGMRFQLI